LFKHSISEAGFVWAIRCKGRKVTILLGLQEALFAVFTGQTDNYFPLASDDRKRSSVQNVVFERTYGEGQYPT
jgi:hypothetical protein